jgi:cohesin complex subunit SA-1/2
LQDGLDEAVARRVHTKAARSLRLNYLEAWDKVVRESHAAGLLLDGHLTDAVGNFVTALAQSAVRPFRQVATLTAVQLVSSYIHVAAQLGEAAETAERQAAAEGRRKGGGVAGAKERAEAFRRTVDRCRSSVRQLHAAIDALFQAVFAHRFRDVCPEVRATVVEGIGRWVRLLPATFLSDTYLKYLAWALSDREREVRFASASALLAIYEKAEPPLGALHDFAARFTARFLELVYDRDNRVAATGIKLLISLVRLGELQPAAVGDAYRLLGDEDAEVRHEAAGLVVGLLPGLGAKALEGSPSAAAAVGGAGGRRSRGGGGASKADQVFGEADVRLAGLLQVARQMAGEVAGGFSGPLDEMTLALVVDALWDK